MGCGSASEGLIRQPSQFDSVSQNHNNNNNNNDNVYGAVSIINIVVIIIITVLSSWQSHCESSPGSFDEYRMAPSGRRPKTKPDDLGCESACTGCQKLHHRHLLLLSPKADTHFTVPQRVVGWVDLAGWLHTKMVYPSTDGHPSGY